MDPWLLIRSLFVRLPVIRCLLRRPAARAQASSLTLPALGPGITLFRRPALSLLVGTANPEAAKIQKSLQALQRSCGGTVSRAEVASSFGLVDVLTSDWPERLPVNCPG